MKKSAPAAIVALCVTMLVTGDALAAKRSDGHIPRLGQVIKRFVMWAHSRWTPPLPAPAPDPGQP